MQSWDHITFYYLCVTQFYSVPCNTQKFRDAKSKQRKKKATEIDGKMIASRKEKHSVEPASFCQTIGSIWSHFLPKSWFYFQVLMQIGVECRQILHCRQSNWFESLGRKLQIVPKTLRCMYRNQWNFSDSFYSMRIHGFILQAARKWKAAKKSTCSNTHRNHQPAQSVWKNKRKWSSSSIPVPTNNCLSSFSQVSHISLRKLSVFPQLNTDFYWCLFF